MPKSSLRVRAEGVRGIQSSSEVAFDAGVIRVHVVELWQLFNPMDPSPLRDRDLDPNAEEYIVSSGREAPHTAQLRLLVDLDRPAGAVDEVAQLREAMHRFFETRAAVTRRRLRELFRTGRISLVIGVAFLGAALIASQLIDAFLPGGVFGVLRESLLIGGWVAMWRPIEIFLYDWWPIRADARLFDRLAAMPVHVRHTAGEAPNVRRA